MIFKVKGAMVHRQQCSAHLMQVVGDQDNLEERHDETRTNPYDKHRPPRDVTESDLPIFFEQQLDPEAKAMAAFQAFESETA